MCAPKGTRPDAIKQQQFEYAHIYGVVCATNGKTEVLITPNLSKKIMIARRLIEQWLSIEIKNNAASVNFNN
jgi:hypothetical protein